MKNRYILSALLLVFLSASLSAQDSVGQTGSTTTLGEDEFTTGGASNASFLLQGLDPSLWMDWSSGRASAVSTPSLRGFQSYSGTTPLVIVDGVEGSLDRVRPEDIKDITILKDAAAAAIYGARAAAGAIVVSTKDGSGPKSIRASVNGGLSGRTHGHGSSYYSSSRRTASAMASAEGGDNSLRYYVGANAYGEDGEIDRSYGDNGYGNLSVRANFEAKVFKWLRYSLNANYAYTTESLPYWQGYDVLEEALAGESADMYAQAMLSGYNFCKSSDHYAMFKNSLEAVLGPDFTARVSYAFTHEYLFRQKRSSPVDGVSEDIAPNRYLEERGNSKQNSLDAYLRYSHIFGTDHGVTARVGFDYQDAEGKDLDVFVGGLIDPDISALTVGDSDFTIDEGVSKYAQEGVYGSASYAFRQKYFIDATLRADASSRFFSGDKWALSPAVSAAWLISEEQFFEAAKDIVGLLKLRYSFSSTANQRVSYLYPYLTFIELNKPLDGWILSRGQQTEYTDFAYRGNEDLKWERVLTHDVGLDAGFLGGRLSFGADFFLRDISDMITYERTLPGVYGGIALTNSGTLRTLGTELSLKWSDKVELGGKPLRYTSSLSASAYDSEISDFPLSKTPDLPDKTLAFRALAQWNGLDAKLLLHAASDPGYTSLAVAGVGYSFGLGENSPLKSLRIGVDARNLASSSACPLPSVVMANVSVKF